MMKRKQLIAEIALMEKILHSQQNSAIWHKKNLKNHFENHKDGLYTAIAILSIPFFIWSWRHKKLTFIWTSVKQLTVMTAMTILSQLKDTLWVSLSNKSNDRIER